MLVEGSKATRHHLAQTTVILGRGVKQFVEGRRIVRAGRGEGGGGGPMGDEADRSIGVEYGTTNHVFHSNCGAGADALRRQRKRRPSFLWYATLTCLGA